MTRPPHPPRRTQRIGWRRRRGSEPGRNIATLLTDAGHDLPTPTPTPPARGRQPRLFRHTPNRGPARPGAGWSPARAPVASWRMSSDQAGVFWPFIAAPGLPPTGAQLGIDELSGGAFHVDPLGWVLDPTIPVTNGNIFVFGEPGLGKTATVKALLLRMMDFGYRAVILGDPKDEYEPLCTALGVHPFRIGPGLPARINPLDLGPLGHGWDRLDPATAQTRATVIFARWLTLLRALVGSQHIGEHRVPVGPSDDTVLTAALHALTGYTTGATTLAPTTIPALWHALHEPTPDLVTACQYASRRTFLDQTRLLRDALGHLVHGALAGMFDAPTTITVDWTAPIQSLSLRSLRPLGDVAVGTALLCLNSWGTAMRDLAAPDDLRINVRDESWYQLRLGPEAVKSLDADLRLSRTDGEFNIVISHKPSDPLTAGDAGSQAVAIATDLLHLADIKVLHGQDHAVAADLHRLLGLGPIAQDLVTGWAKHGQGRALWCVGDRLYQVHTILTPLERRLTDTNTRIAGAA